MGDSEMESTSSQTPQSNHDNAYPALQFLLEAAKPCFNWDENTTSKFKQEFFASIDKIVRTPKQILIDTFGVFNKKDCLLQIRDELAIECLKSASAELIDFYEPKRRNNNSNNRLAFEDIYLFCQHLVNNQPITKSKEFENLFNEKKTTTATTITWFLTKQHEMLDLIKHQSSEIDELKKIISKTNQILEKVLDDNTRSNKPTSSSQQLAQLTWPPPHTSFTNSNFPSLSISKNPFVPLNHPTTSAKSTNQTYTPHNPQKRAHITHQNDAPSNKTNQTPISYNRKTYKQTTVKNYDSMNDPDGHSKVIENPNPWFLKGNKLHLNANQYAKKVGTNTKTQLKSIPRMQRVFMSRLDNETSVEKLEEYLKTVKYKYVTYVGDEDAEKPIDKQESLIFSNIREAQLKHKEWKAFTFDIALAQKDIINMKDIWPDGSFVTQSHTSYKPTANLTAAASSTSQTDTQTKNKQ